jgi:hypothetical protein
LHKARRIKQRAFNFDLFLQAKNVTIRIFEQTTWTNGAATPDSVNDFLELREMVKDWEHEQQQHDKMKSSPEDISHRSPVALVCL